MTPKKLQLWFIPPVSLLFVLACNLFTPGATPTVQPTSTSPPPTATPVPPLEPVVADVFPGPGETIAIDGAIDLYFDQAMAQDSLAGALSLEPSVAGAIEWLDNKTARFIPSEPLARAARYRLVVDTSARSAAGLNLAQEFSTVVDTVGFLEVTQVLPAADTIGVEVGSAITVLFNRPVVPLTTLAEQGDLPNPLVLDPPVNGTAEWLNTSIFIFRPEVALAGGTEYIARVDSGLMDTTGGLLQEDFKWSFTTLSPQVIEASPFFDAGNIPLEVPISILFNQPMDRTTTQAAFSLLSERGEPVTGIFEWAENDTSLTFTPERRLALETGYVATLEESALGAAGQTHLGAQFTWKFNTVFSPSIALTQPFDGLSGVDPFGGFRIEFASPMDEDTLADQITIEPEPKEVFTFYSEYDFSYFINWDFEPSTDYIVTLGANMADPYGNRVGRDSVVRFSTAPYDPSIVLNTRGIVGTYSAYSDSRVFATYRNVSEIVLDLYRMPLSDFARYTGRRSFEFRDTYIPETENLMRSWSVPVEFFLNENAFAEIELREDGGRLDPDLYFLRIQTPYGNSDHLLSVADANLTLKTGFESVLVWATDQQSGQPAAGREVELYDENLQLVDSGTTDATGLFASDALELADLWTPIYVVSTTESVPALGGVRGFALAVSDWTEGIAPWEFGVFSSSSPDKYESYFYTDRPLYRPGQMVAFKGILRNENDARFSLPHFETVNVQIYNDRGDVVYDEALSFSEFGSVNGEFELDAEAGTGFYRLDVTSDDDEDFYGGVSFQVAEYVKPEFQVVVTTAESEVAAGDEIAAAVDATFFFGGPVSGSRIDWTLLSADHFFPWGPGRYDFTDFDFTADVGGPSYGVFGEVIATGTDFTDAEGRYEIDLQADLGDRTTSQLFTFEATVTDINNRSVSGRTEVIVHKGDYYIGLRPERYVGTAGNSSVIEIITVDWAQEPWPEQELEIVVSEHEWFSVQEEDEFGNTVWTWEVEDTPIFDTTLTTDDSGEATFNFVPEAGGIYKILARGQDAAGRRVQSSTFQWVSSGAYVPWRQENNNRIELIADRPTYAPGDTAEILIASPFQGAANALITVERSGVMLQEVLTLDSNSTVYKLPIIADYAPNVFVSVIIVKGVDETNRAAAFRAGLLKLGVSPEQQEIQVSLTPDSERVGPQEDVTYAVAASDYEGNPLQAEFSLAVADLAALSLSAPNVPPILDSFYGERPLRMQTATGLALSVDVLNIQTADRKGGGGGGAEEGFFEVRGDFRDTAFWAPAVVTDENGEAQVTVTLPDNLTTWRLDARGITTDTLVGEGTVDVVATKDLLIRPVTPRFFVVGDRVELAAVVNNNTEQDIEAEVSISSIALDLDSPAAQTVTIPAGGRERVTWQASVPDGTSADIIFTVEGGGYRDASKPPLGQPPDQRIPIYKYSAPQTAGTAGALDEAGERTEIIALPRRFDVTQGELKIQVNPSLAAGMVAALEALDNTKYTSTEATVSRFLPNVLTLRALQDLGIDDPALEDELEQAVMTGVQKLYAQQHTDGGWGWYNTDESNEFITAYVVFGLNRAREADFPIEQSVLANAADYLLRTLQLPDVVEETWLLNRQVFTLFALAEYGEMVPSAHTQYFDNRQRLDTYARALLALTLHAADPSDPRIDTLLSDLNNSAVLSATGAHWSETRARDYWNMNTDVRTTAIALSALVSIDPQSDLNPNVVRWLMSAREATGGWETTQETAFALIALTDWLAVTEELAADYEYGVAVNGAQVASSGATTATIPESAQASIAISDLYVEQANRVLLTRGDGAGNLYYTAHLTVFQNVEDVQALNRGIVVGREYSLVSDDCGGFEQPDCPTITSAHVGDQVEVRVTLVAPTDLHYVVLEDPIPAGTEPIDTSLLTTSVVGQAPELDRTDPFYYGWGWWWFSNTDLRDEKVVLSATYLPAGTYEYTYRLNVALAGEYNVIPTTAFETYFPEVFGRGDGVVFTVLPQE